MRGICLIGLASLLAALPLGAQQPTQRALKQKPEPGWVRDAFQGQDKHDWPRCEQEIAKWNEKLVLYLGKRPGLKTDDLTTYPTIPEIYKDIPEFSPQGLAQKVKSCEFMAYSTRNRVVFASAIFLDETLHNIEVASDAKDFEAAKSLMADYRELANEPLARLGQKEKPLPLRIVAEHVDGSEAYQFAAADVIGTQFGNWFELDPKADLVLYIGGTKGLGSYEAMTQEVPVQLYLYLSPRLAAGEKTRRVTGTFVLAEEATLMKNFPSDKRVQSVKEQVYAALNEFIQKWEEAASQ